MKAKGGMVGNSAREPQVARTVRIIADANPLRSVDRSDAITRRFFGREPVEQFEAIVREMLRWRRAPG
jgi:hypothetical protein